MEVARVGRDRTPAGNHIAANRPYRLNSEHLFERVPARDRIQVEKGDITEQAVHVVVNAANESLLGGGGSMARSIRAARPALLERVQKAPAEPSPARSSSRAHKLPARWVAHAVGPTMATRTCW